ncbi:hypothetical protein ACFZAR_36350 [Streptomyces sp. NPDC008222]|uniref:hypothetical protein n=1 Tax=Streptomyces sp. NPDC008222 TaxID=3364820 RepID=UPI0036E9961E
MSNHAIPTEPQDDPSESIMAALAHGMTGNPQAGLALLKPFFESPRHMVSLCAALAESTAMVIRQQAPDADGFAIVALHDNTLADVNDMPAGERFAAQFTSSWVNGQPQTAYALFDALHAGGSEQDAANVADGVLALYQMAIASMQSLTGRTSH